MRTTAPKKVEIISLPCPIFEGGEKLVMQRGTGNLYREIHTGARKACMTFLKWLTEPKRNVDFATSRLYAPVTRRALTATCLPLFKR